MKISALKERQNNSDNAKLTRIYLQLGEYIKELNKKELPARIVETVNQHIEEINVSSLSENSLMKLVKWKQMKLVKLIEKELKIVPKNYYRNLWLAVGMSAFGLPIGVAFGLTLGNMGFLAIGLPIGMGIGIVVGSRMDKKAFESNRQLAIDIKY